LPGGLLDQRDAVRQRACGYVDKMEPKIAVGLLVEQLKGERVLELIRRAAVARTKPWFRMKKTVRSYVPSARTPSTSRVSRREAVKARYRLSASVHTGERSKKTAALPAVARTAACLCR